MKLRQLADDLDQSGAHIIEIRAPLDPLFVHVERPVDLDLKRVHLRLGPTVMGGNVAPGEGGVARHAEPRPLERAGGAPVLLDIEGVVTDAGVDRPPAGALAGHMPFARPRPTAVVRVDRVGGLGETGSASRRDSV